MRIFMFEEFGICVFSVFEINDNAKNDKILFRNENLVEFYFVRLTLRLAALASRTSYAEFHASASYTVC